MRPLSYRNLGNLPLPLAQVVFNLQNQFVDEGDGYATSGTPTYGSSATYGISPTTTGATGNWSGVDVLDNGALGLLGDFTIDILFGRRAYTGTTAILNHQCPPFPLSGWGVDLTAADQITFTTLGTFGVDSMAITLPMPRPGTIEHLRISHTVGGPVRMYYNGSQEAANYLSTPDTAPYQPLHLITPASAMLFAFRILDGQDLSPNGDSFTPPTVPLSPI